MLGHTRWRLARLESPGEPRAAKGRRRNPLPLPPQHLSPQWAPAPPGCRPLPAARLSRNPPPVAAGRRGWWWCFLFPPRLGPVCCRQGKAREAPSPRRLPGPGAPRRDLAVRSLLWSGLPIAVALRSALERNSLSDQD